MKKLFFAAIIIVILAIASVAVVTFVYKDRAIRYAVEKSVATQLPYVKFSMGSATMNFPAQLVFTQISLKDQLHSVFIDIDRMELEFYPSKVLKYFQEGGKKSALKYFFVTAKKIQYREVLINGLRLEGRLYNDGETVEKYAGFMASKDFLYKKIKMDDLRTEFEFKDKTLLVTMYHLLFAGGTITGTLKADLLDSGFEYTAYVDMQNLQAKNLMIIFNLNKKLEMSGLWNGSVKVKGISGKGITSVEGKLVADAKGGEMVITDQAMISSIASRAGIAKDEVARSLARHDYDDGAMELGMDGNTVKLNLSLSGDTGQRNFDIYLHDFLQ